MKKGLTELVFILDRSGSMEGLEKDTIGGFNGVIKKQKKEVGHANITTVLFDDQYELLHDHYDLSEVDKITSKEYYVRGTTALLDAIGKTINKVKAAQKHTAPNHQAEKVLFVIITDGMENASTEYTYKQIHKMVSHQKEKHGWEFLFLGANIDAVETGKRFGISEDRAVNYHADKAGTAISYQAISETASMLRKSRSISKGWKKKIDLDYQSR
jgi:uncharacterized protein YegL